MPGTSIIVRPGSLLTRAAGGKVSDERREESLPRLGRRRDTGPRLVQAATERDPLGLIEETDQGFQLLAFFARQVCDVRLRTSELQLRDMRCQRLLYPIVGCAHVVTPPSSTCVLIFIVAAATICPTRCPEMGGSSSRPTAARLLPATRTAKKTMRSFSESAR